MIRKQEDILSKSQEQIEQELVSRYVKNLEFFKNNFPELFQKIELLSTALNEGLYKEKFALEYLQEIKDFDILDLEKNIYLYNKSFSSYNKQKVNLLDLEKGKSCFSFNKSVYKISAPSYSLPNTKFNLLDEYLSRDISDMKSVFTDINSSNNYKYIEKMFFLGTLLGGHIEASIKKIKPQLVFIIEPNLELFRLSLFVTDYTEISKVSHLLFSVMDEQSIFVKKLDLFISEYFQFSNYNIKYSKLDFFPDAMLNLILTKLHLENPFIFDYTKVLYDTVYFISKHINKYNILTLKKKNDLSSFFKNKPVLFVGAGPSLSKNIEWIKENQDCFIIVAMGAVYKKLFESKIKVDIVTTADSQYEVLEETHFNDEDALLLKDTIVVASIGTPTKILNKFNQEKLFLFETYQSIKHNSEAYNGASIGEVTLSILLDLEVENIYMIGIDLAIDEKSGASHYDGYINQREVISENSQLDEYIKTGKKSSQEEFFQIKGAIKEKVITNRIFSLSIAKYEELILKFKNENQQIFNLSSDAAYIDGVNFMDKEKFSLSSLKLANSELYSIIKENSEYGLGKDEIEYMSKRIKSIESLHSSILNFFINKKARNIPQFINNMNSIFKEIVETNDYICSNLLSNYFKVMLPYIYYILNDEKIKPKTISKKVEEVQKVLEIQLDKILETYISYLKNMIRK